MEIRRRVTACLGVLSILFSAGLFLLTPLCAWRLGVGEGAMLGVGMLGMALLAVSFASGRRGRRISELQESLSALEKGDLGARADTGAGGKDEITGLLLTFNSMAERLQETQRGLERQVAALSVELQQQKESALALRQGTELERAELERHLLYTQKWESMGVFAAGIAHDFNNLLMGISGNMELLRQLTDAGSPVLKYVDNAFGASRRAADLTRQMLAYASKGGECVKQVDLNRLVGESVELMKASMGKGIVLSVRLSPALPMFEADPSQMQQVVRNLVTNAVEAIGEGAGTINVATGMREFLAAALAQSRLEQKPSPGQFIFVEVADSGCGMDREAVQGMFDPFFTTKSAGRGLGLTAVMGIITRYQGAILVGTAPGEGTTVTVLLPAPAAAAEPRKLTGHGN